MGIQSKEKPKERKKKVEMEMPIAFDGTDRRGEEKQVHESYSGVCMLNICASLYVFCI